MAHCSAMLCPQVTLSGDAEWPKVADTVIEAYFFMCFFVYCLFSSQGRALFNLCFFKNADGICNTWEANVWVTMNHGCKERFFPHSIAFSGNALSPSRLS